VTFAEFLESMRDRVVHRSQIGKRKLDRSAVRRQLDEANRQLGERFRALLRTGRVEVPAELARFVEAVKGLEEQLQEIDRKLAQLKGEQHLQHGSTT